MRSSGFDKAMKEVDEIIGGFCDVVKSIFSRKPGAKVRKHRISTLDGHITIEGEYKSLTVNGKKIPK